ncbi:MAG TPA: enoyl-CoA hydratase-related protein [Actinomycetota bacterium]|nr:enoyl-CoA hydratase-related protein [Actinomycetota bacterium]
MPYETIAYGVDAGLATITLNRPDKRNAINTTMFGELGDAAEEAAADGGVRAVLVRGEGPSFCAGIDLAAFGEQLAAPPEQMDEFVVHAQRPFAVLAGMAKPTVAAVQGHALGAGCQLALGCDLRVAAEGTSFGILELNFGIIPDLGGNARLAGLVGPARAKELIWTSARFDAEQAERWGVVNRVVPVGELAGTAEALAREVAGRAPIPVRHVKALVDRAEHEPLEAVMAGERAAQGECLTSADHKEAVAAYFERREPRFSDR